MAQAEQTTSGRHAMTVRQFEPSSVATAVRHRVRRARRAPPSAIASRNHAPMRRPRPYCTTIPGGNFWDMRATGRRLGNPAAEQAQGPPTNPVEMGLPDIACAVYRASQRPCAFHGAVTSFLFLRYCWRGYRSGRRPNL